MAHIVAIGAAFEGLNEVEAICEEARDQGHDTTLVDTLEWPDGPELTARDDGTVYIGDETIHATDVDGVFVIPEDVFMYAQRHYSEEMEQIDEFQRLMEHRSLVDSLAFTFSSHGARMSCPAEDLETHIMSLWHSRRYDGQGLPTPKSVVTNNPERVKEFCHQHDEVIVKSVGGGPPPKKITAEDLDPSLLGKLDFAPVMLQEFAEGVDVRVFVVDGEAIGAFEYEYEGVGGTKAVSGAEKISPPESVINTAVEATKSVGLPFGTVDLVWDGEDEEVLEVNEAGRFAWVSEETGCNIAEPIVDYLSGK